MTLVSILALSATVSVAAAAPGLRRFRSSGGIKPYSDPSSVEMMETADVDLELNLLKALQESVFALNPNELEIERTLHNINDVDMRMLNSQPAVEHSQDVRMKDGTASKESSASDPVLYIEDNEEYDAESSRLSEDCNNINAEVSNLIECIEAYCADKINKFPVVGIPDLYVTKRKINLRNIDDHKMWLIGKLHEHFKQYKRKHNKRTLYSVNQSLTAMLRCYKDHCDKNVAKFAEIHDTLPIMSFPRNRCNGSTVCDKRAANLQKNSKQGEIK